MATNEQLSFDLGLDTLPPVGTFNSAEYAELVDMYNDIRQLAMYTDLYAGRELRTYDLQKKYKESGAQASITTGTISVFFMRAGEAIDTGKLVEVRADGLIYNHSFYITDGTFRQNRAIGMSIDASAVAGELIAILPIGAVKISGVVANKSVNPAVPPNGSLTMEGIQSPYPSWVRFFSFRKLCPAVGADAVFIGG